MGGHSWRGVRRWGRLGHRADDGFAAVDALVALAVLSATIVFSLAALHTSRLAAEAALEARQAGQLLKELLDGTAGQPGVVTGQNARFAWRVEVQPPVLVAGASALCRREAEARARRTGRAYALTSARVCASGGA